MGKRLIVGLGIALLVHALAAAPARAASVRKVDMAQWTGGATLGLIGPQGVVLSPDQRHLYVVNQDDSGTQGTVSVFARDLTTGALSFVETEWLSGSPFAQPAVAISPDGLHVYVLDQAGFLVRPFARDASTGALTALDPVVANGATLDGDAMAPSPDGRFLFLAGSDNVASFARDASTGDLTLADRAMDGQNGVTGLRRGAALAPSPDGKHLYVGSVDVDGTVLGALFVFAVDGDDGSLSLLQRIGAGDAGISALDEPWNLDVSPDGASVYVSGPGDSIATFARDASTGLLTFVGVAAGAGFTAGAEFGTLAVTPDGDRVLVTAWHRGAPFPGFPDGIAIFRRDPATGALTFDEALLEDETWPPDDGLTAPTGMALTADGRFAYLASNGDHALTAFRLLPFCATAPLTSCRKPASPGAATLELRDGAAPARDAVQWKWRRGEETLPAAFGDPTSDTDLTFCVHVRSGSAWRPAIELTIPAGSTCANDSSCWRARGNPPGSKGWRYHDQMRANDGVVDLTLQPGGDGKTMVTLLGRGADLGLPSLPLVSADELRVQLVSGDGQCWGADHAAPFRVHDGRRLISRSE